MDIDRIMRLISGGDWEYSADDTGGQLVKEVNGLQLFVAYEKGHPTTWGVYRKGSDDLLAGEKEGYSRLTLGDALIQGELALKRLAACTCCTCEVRS